MDRDGQLRERALTDQRKAVEREDRGVRRRVRVRFVMPMPVPVQVLVPILVLLWLMLRCLVLSLHLLSFVALAVFDVVAVVVFVGGVGRWPCCCRCW